MISKVRSNQKGFSLIEMMVAMLIGLFLMGGVISVFISSSQSSKVNNATRTIQENSRFARITLKNIIQMAGYIDSYDPSVIVDPFPGGANNFNQKISVRYQADQDCTGTSTLGLAAPNTGFAQNLIELNVAGELTCTGNAGTAAGVAAQVIIDGVDQIRFLYGLDDNNDGIADRYVNASTITATAAGWTDKVSSVRVGLLLNSVANLKSANETKNYPLLDVNSADITDRKLHKVFTTTILIRNRMI